MRSKAGHHSREKIWRKKQTAKRPEWFENQNRWGKKQTQVRSMPRTRLWRISVLRRRRRVSVLGRHLCWRSRGSISRRCCRSFLGFRSLRWPTEHCTTNWATNKWSRSSRSNWGQNTSYIMDNDSIENDKLSKKKKKKRKDIAIEKQVKIGNYEE